MKKWVEYLNADVGTRLAECRNRKADLPHLVDTRWQYLKYKRKDKEGFTKEDALVQVLYWLDCNNQWFDLTRDEYNKLKGE